MRRIVLGAPLACLIVMVSPISAQVVPPFAAQSPDGGLLASQFFGGGIGFGPNGAFLATPPFSNNSPISGILLGSRYGPLGSRRRYGNYGPVNPGMWQPGLPNAAPAPPAQTGPDRSEVREAQNARALDSLLRKAESAESGGRAGVAAMYYRMALKRATGAQKADLQRRLARLGVQAAPPR